MRRLVAGVIGEHSRPSKHDLSPRAPGHVLEASQPIRETPALTPMTQCVHQQRKCRRGLASAWIIEVIAGIWRAPIFKHPFETALGEMRLCQILRHIGQAESGKRRSEHLESAVEDELALDAHLEFAITFFELPGVQAAVCGQTQIDAVVTDQVLGLLRF